MFAACGQGRQGLRLGCLPPRLLRRRCFFARADESLARGHTRHHPEPTQTQPHPIQHNSRRPLHPQNQAKPSSAPSLPAPSEPASLRPLRCPAAPVPIIGPGPSSNAHSPTSSSTRAAAVAAAASIGIDGRRAKNAPGRHRYLGGSRARARAGFERGARRRRPAPHSRPPPRGKLCLPFLSLFPMDKEEAVPRDHKVRDWGDSRVSRWDRSCLRWCVVRRRRAHRASQSRLSPDHQPPRLTSLHSALPHTHPTK